MSEGKAVVGLFDTGKQAPILVHCFAIQFYMAQFVLRDVYQLENLLLTFFRKVNLVSSILPWLARAFFCRDERIFRRDDTASADHFVVNPLQPWH